MRADGTDEAAPSEGVEWHWRSNADRVPGGRRFSSIDPDGKASRKLFRTVRVGEISDPSTIDWVLAGVIRRQVDCCYNAGRGPGSASRRTSTSCHRRICCSSGPGRRMGGQTFAGRSVLEASGKRVAKNCCRCRASWLTKPETRAAGVGFEPTDRLATVNGFQDRPVRPLRHPAVCTP